MNQGPNTISCGMDEAGRGPVLGPMVIAIVCGDRDILSKTGARDSKALTPSMRVRIDQRIREVASWVDLVAVTPSEINMEMSSTTLNEIEYRRYLELIIRSPACGTVYVDAFDVNQLRLQERLCVDSGREVVCRHRADSEFVEVSAASVIAKVARDSKISELHEKYGDFGSGYPSDPRTVKFLETSLSEGINLDDIARTKWKTYIDIRNKVFSRKLF